MRGWPEQPFPTAAGTSAADSILPTPTSSLRTSSASIAWPSKLLACSMEEPVAPHSDALPVVLAPPPPRADG